MTRSDLAQLRVFSLVVERGGFRAAAQVLGVAPSAVSHAIAKLEGALDIRLLARTSRKVAPTEAGQRLLERLAPALAEIDDAVRALDDDRDVASGLLRITMPRTAFELVIFPRLAAFARDYPRITLDVRIEDAFSDVVTGGFDGGVRLGESLERDMIAVPLGPPQRLAVVAAPSLFAGRKKPTHPTELSAFPCINRRFGGGPLYRWELGEGKKAVELSPQGPLVLNDDRLILESAIRGVGIAITFEAFAAPEIASGRLVRLLASWCPPFPGFYFYYTSRRQLRPALRSFIDAFRHRRSLATAPSRSRAVTTRP